MCKNGRRNGMKLLFKQRLFSWLDSYDIYDENEQTVYVVKGQLAIGHCLNIFDAAGDQLGTVKPKYDIDFNGWHIEGSFMEWDDTITGANGERIATISKQLFRMTDTYVLDIARVEDALHVLMFVLAIDAEKCSRDQN